MLGGVTARVNGDQFIEIARNIHNAPLAIGPRMAGFKRFAHRLHTVRFVSLGFAMSFGDDLTGSQSRGIFQMVLPDTAQQGHS
jgi:hypothetical protein